MDHCPEQDPRRSFLKKVLATLFGTLAGLIPPVAGIAVILDPLRRKSAATESIRVASLDAIPADGVPRKFPVLASRTDAWTKSPNTPIGAVYIRRTGPSTVEVLNVVCPHAGCFVDFVPDRKGYFCPCHNSSFDPTGKINDPKSPSPRDLDTLEWEVRNGREVYVKFRNFRAGHKEKLPA